ncbi:secretin N-terminal domain-containing protein [Crateriforma spongiae]|uniref:secretin N-terminal domain-containing protein n=1 Tax=Crateriforma spongiae TaxID=2724528 RepID=UPI00144782F9|nr:secretin N-terminal domain-containing protein [Crateriforma spongiae]
MRRSFTRACAAALLMAQTGWVAAQYPNPVPVSQTVGQAAADAPQLKKLRVPGSAARRIATTMSLRYRDVPGISIQPDPQNNQVVVLAPAREHGRIASEVRKLVTSAVQPASAQTEGPLKVQLTAVTWREFEDAIAQVIPEGTPVTTSRNGERAAFQLTSAPLTGTTVQVDRRLNTVTVIAPQPAVPGWQEMIDAIDGGIRSPGDVMQLVRLQNAEPAPIQRAIRLLREVESNQAEAMAAIPAPAGRLAQVPLQNAMFQAPAPQDGASDAGEPPANEDELGAQGVAGDTELQFIPELGMIIIKGAKKDVQRVREIISEIERQSELTRPEVEVVRLEHADANAVETLLQQLYEDVLSTRQGEVSITSLDTPNALLLIGRQEAIASLMDLIQKIDQPINENDRLRVFRLQHASAVDAEETIRGFFTEQPGSSDDPRPGLGIRVRISADYRTNSLIVSASQRDLAEVTRLINELDVQQIAAQSEIRTFTLRNTLAEDLADTLNEIIAPGEGDEASPPSTTLSIVKLGSEGSEQLDSGVLVGAVVTADTNTNTIIVKAPSTSMPLIGELIRQLDRPADVESLVKVFTLENGDATNLTAALQSLFGDDAATSGTSVGAGNLADSTASESSLTPLRFSAEIRTNSIVASGSAEDLEVVESILLRLDSEGFAERITEVIWLRHQDATQMAEALQQYVSSRSQSQNQYTQFQQGGLGPFDMLDRDLIVVPEDRTNSLIISVAPRLYPDVRRLVDRLDRRPPMIMVKTVIAEVRLNDRFEIGGELGLQDSLLFDRDIAGGATGVPPYSDNGYNFNGTNLPNINNVFPNTLASRGVTTFGVGTSSADAGVGGFVLNAASESVNMLFRTLQTAGRLQIISRPQITTADNTEALIQVGQDVARPQDVVVTNNNTAIGVEDVSVGLILRIFPRVGSDGQIYMEIDAERSAINNTDPGQVIGNFDGAPVVVPPIDITRAQSTLTAYSGQTVIFGGLIQKTRENVTRRVPYLSNIPLLGYMFKYDEETEARSELLLVMTPMLINGEEDLEYIKQTESSRMSWCLADVVEAHGDVGLSHGYGLWGPAVGPTIYPDMTPTIDGVMQEQIISQQVVNGNASGEACVQEGAVIQSQPVELNDGMMIQPQPYQPPAGAEIPFESTLPADAPIMTAPSAMQAPTQPRAPQRIHSPENVQPPVTMTPASPVSHRMPTSGVQPSPAMQQSGSAGQSGNVGGFQLPSSGGAAANPEPVVAPIPTEAMRQASWNSQSSWSSPAPASTTPQATQSGKVIRLGQGATEVSANAGDTTGQEPAKPKRRFPKVSPLSWLR